MCGHKVVIKKHDIGATLNMISSVIYHLELHNAISFYNLCNFLGSEVVNCCILSNEPI